MKHTLKLSTLIATALLVSACGQTETNTVQGTFSKLDVLGDDYVYEGWLITPTGPKSAGRFQSAGASTNFNFTLDKSIVEAATAYVLTIEPVKDDLPAPSDVHILAGDLISNGASLSISHPAAVGQDFSGATGVFGLAAPSDDTGTATYRNGIWWIRGGQAGLTLPTLPKGWAYEGWVADANGPVSTGRFTSVTGADSDGAGATGGSNPAPAFPGQDFVKPQLVDLIGKTAVISVEPEPDNAAGPFGIKPLIDATIEDVGPLPSGATQPMALVIADNRPSGSISIK